VRNHLAAAIGGLVLLRIHATNHAREIERQRLKSLCDAYSDWSSEIKNAYDYVGWQQLGTLATLLKALKSEDGKLFKMESPEERGPIIERMNKTVAFVRCAAARVRLYEKSENRRETVKRITSGFEPDNMTEATKLVQSLDAVAIQAYFLAEIKRLREAGTDAMKVASELIDQVSATTWK
jgi:hypothetical protein